MEKLSEKEWKAITLEDEFHCDKGIYLPTDSVFDGNIPYVTAKAENNGVGRFIGNKILFPGNSITVEKVKLSAYYQPSPFYCSHDVSVLSNQKLDEENSLFIAEMIMRNGSKYSYGRQAQLNVVKREKIILPIDAESNLDFGYMHDYVRQIQSALLKKYILFVEKQLEALGEETEIENLKEVKWKPIKIADIANVFSGHDIYATERIPGNIPLVTAIGNNNGIGYFVGNMNDSYSSHCISVVRNGASVARAYYHKYKALFGNDCRRIILKTNNSEYVGLFISLMIAKQKDAFSYSRKLGTERLKNLRIMLPVTESGNPDYQYMEQYAKNMMLKKYHQYLAFIRKHYPNLENEANAADQ